MSVLTLAGVLVSARTFVGDGATDNFVRLENANNQDIGNVINATNTTFAAQNFPIATAGLFRVVSDGAIVTPASVDEPQGMFTLAVAPASSLILSYYYYYFNDTTWTEFVTAATQALNLATDQGVEVDVSNIPDGLGTSLKAYCAWAFSLRMAGQTGAWYNQKLQEREELRDSISGKYLKLAQEYKKSADALRDAFYTGAGANFKPSFAIVQMSPRQYTPSR